MKARHRIPTIFNLSMVDVLCCALGCVILLWLLNLREAKMRAEAASQSDQLLQQARAQLSATEDDLTKALARQRDTAGQLRSAVRDRDAARADVTSLQRLNAATEERLAKKVKEQTDLSKQMAAAKQSLAALDVLVREKETMARTAAKTADDLADRLRDLDNRAKLLQAQADKIPSLQDEAKDSRNKLAAAEARITDLEKVSDERKSNLAGAGQTIDSLKEENRQLNVRLQRVQQSAENRFAGMALTGKRVVFLVNMSGSMELVDENTAAPEKWTGVRSALAQIMRSLPELEKFQVILFSNKLVYPLGKEGQWFDFDPVASTASVAKAMAAIKPTGNTDMYAAFNAAFRYRDQGLDTIYVFSDGLPNIGEGLSAQEAQNLDENKRSDILSKYVRLTLKTSWNRKGMGKQVRVNTVGFFYESPEVGEFLWALARENDGSFVGMSKP